MTTHASGLVSSFVALTPPFFHPCEPPFGLLLFFVGPTPAPDMLDARYHDDDRGNHHDERRDAEDNDLRQDQSGDEQGETDDERDDGSLHTTQHRRLSASGSDFARELGVVGDETALDLFEDPL